MQRAPSETQILEAYEAGQRHHERARMTAPRLNLGCHHGDWLNVTHMGMDPYTERKEICGRCGAPRYLVLSTAGGGEHWIPAMPVRS